MQLLSTTVQGFQSYRDPVTVSFDPRLTVIAGRNNVGKSALLRALRLLVDPSSGCQADFELSYIWCIPRETFALAADVTLLDNVPEDLSFRASFRRANAPESERGEIVPG